MDKDFLLIRKMKMGEEEAIEIFVRKYYADILQYCKYHCFEIQYAEDLAQETFVHFFENLSVYRHIGKAKNYLYTIAGNLCKDYYKKTTEIPTEKLPETGEDQIEQVQDRLLIEEALNKLPEELKEIVVLYYFQGLKLREISDLIHIKLPLVKYRIKRAKELLGAILSGEGSK